VSTVFGVRSALANLTPMSTALPLGPADIGIPKLLRQSSGEFATFAQILGSPAANYRFDDLYKASGLTVVDNSPEEIRDLAVEMLDTLEDRNVRSQEDAALQRRFQALVRPGHYAYGSTSRIGRDFLRKYAALLSDANA
jgi:putative glycosyltransferase (TIGR04372 family)